VKVWRAPDGAFHSLLLSNEQAIPGEEMKQSSKQEMVWKLATFGGAVVVVALLAGLGGMGLALLLRLIQRLAFEGPAGALPATVSFLDRVIATSPERRVTVLGLCGVIAAAGWWAIHQFGKPLMSISQALRSDDPRMPIMPTIGHALLQIVTIALGSPLGREVAPREIGALVAGWIARAGRFSRDDTTVLVACGAGAGLAAVYNVPFAGALFILEVLLKTTRVGAVVPALASCVIAALVAWIGLGDRSQYLHASYQISASLVAWSLLAGPFFGGGAFLFGRVVGRARKAAPSDGRLFIRCVAVFLALGIAAAFLPDLLGNGQAPTQLGFEGDMPAGLAALTLAGKLVFVIAVLWAGAQGGLLTPGLTLGALGGILLGAAWSVVFPGVPTGAFAIVGACAFLASSMAMPLTAIAIVMEFTGIEHDFMVPLFLAVIGSVAASKACAVLVGRPAPAPAVPLASFEPVARSNGRTDPSLNSNLEFRRPI
jgi:H+/Cl- antiporter ClcA